METVRRFETGTLATIKGDKPGRTILIRGDIDALTVQEETDCRMPARTKVSCTPAAMTATSP